MDRLQRDSRASLLMQQRRGRVGGDAGDDALDLFSRNRRSVPVSGEEVERQHGCANSASVATEFVRLPRSGMDDLLTGSDLGKHDYDWLLTPPGTPLHSSMECSEHQQISAVPKNNLPARRSTSTAKISRFSIPQPDSNQHAKAARSNSLTRSSISAYSGHFSSNSNRNSGLNTSTASVNMIRPSTPTRSSTPSRRSMSGFTPSSTPVSKQATLPRPITSRPLTPVKTHPVLTPGDKSRSTQPPSEKTRIANPSRSSTPTSRPQNPSRPSTPTSHSQISSQLNSISSSAGRPQVPANLNSSSNSIARQSSRSSTPTRRSLAPSTPASRSSSVGRVPSVAGRNSGPPSRPSSPCPKPRHAVQPILPSDITLDAPPNLKTKVPEHPIFTGRTRPGTVLTVRTNPNSERPTIANNARGQSSSPTATRGRFPENSPRSRFHGNGHESTPPEMPKITTSDGSSRKPAKVVGATESTGFGRTISKKSLDMALRHMDIRQSMGSVRGASIFPQSIRCSSRKTNHARKSDSLVYPSVCSGDDPEDVCCNGTISGSGSINGSFSENGDVVSYSPERSYLMSRAIGPDVFESTRYETILLKEDSKNMSWLHSIEDQSDQGSVFDNRFESLPEPFGLL